MFISHATVHYCVIHQLHGEGKEGRKEAALPFLFQGKQFQWVPRSKTDESGAQGGALLPTVSQRQMLRLQMDERHFWKSLSQSLSNTLFPPRNHAYPSGL